MIKPEVLDSSMYLCCCFVLLDMTSCKVFCTSDEPSTGMEAC